MPPPAIPTNASEAETIARLAVLAEGKPLHFTERKGIVILPNGQQINLENERLQANPNRRRASVTLYEGQSFIDYVNRFKVAASTVIFGTASETAGSFRAILDYHDQQSGADAKANWGEHICDLKLAATPEWQRWIKHNGTPLSQEQFAEFIEDNLQDIVTPDGAVLLDLVQFLEAKKSVSFKSGKNLRSGAIEFEYSEQIAETTGRRDEKQELPGRIIVRLTPFVGEASVDIAARLRFRISDSGKLSFTYHLDRPFKVIERAFEAIAAKIETDTTAPVYLGNGAVSPIPSH